MYGHLFDPEQIASDMRQYFEEVEATCGKAWERVVEKNGGTIGKGWTDHSADLSKGMSQVSRSGGVGKARNDKGEMYTVNTLGFRPACACPEHKPIPCTVLDPFSGSGTTAMVAKNLGRHAVGIDRKAEYHEMAIKRLRQDVLPLMLS